MNILNKLAKQYKETKSQETLIQIFQLLERTINDKAKYVFYKQDFVKEKYQIKIWDRDKHKFKKVKRVNTFKLCDTKKMELEDVKQELKMQIIELLNNLNPKKPFDHYLNHILINWRPSYIREINFIKDLDTVKESELFNENEEKSPLEDLSAIEPDYPQEEINIDEMFKNLTNKEKNLIELMIKFPEKNHTKLAKIIGVTRQMVEKMLKNIRKKRS